MATSCNLNEYPVFDDADAFIAFDNTSMSVSESVGTISIPVTLASVAGIETTAAYSVTAGTAAESTNYSLVDPTGVLSFDSENRTAYVELNIVDLAGEFTGDVKFTVELTNSGSVNFGSSSVCTVTIVDNDHPLSSIIGTYYAAEPNSYFYGNGYPVTLTLEKDETDVSIVWITGLADYGETFYGTVNEDCTEIYLPLGQESTETYYGAFVLEACDADLNTVSSGNWVLTITESGSSVTLSNDLESAAFAMTGVYEGSYWDVYMPPFSAVKID